MVFTSLPSPILLFFSQNCGDLPKMSEISELWFLPKCQKFQNIRWVIEFQLVGHNVTRGSVVRHPWTRCCGKKVAYVFLIFKITLKSVFIPRRFVSDTCRRNRPNELGAIRQCLYKKNGSASDWLREQPIRIEKKRILVNEF